MTADTTKSTLQPRSSRSESPLWMVVFLWLVLPGLIVGGAGVFVMVRAGWTLLQLPVWVPGFYLAGVWIAAAGVAVLRRGGPLPRHLKLRTSQSVVPWTLLAPAIMPPAAALMLGMSDEAPSPQFAALVPAAGWLLFVGLPIVMNVMVLLQAVDRVERQS